MGKHVFRGFGLKPAIYKMTIGDKYYIGGTTCGVSMRYSHHLNLLKQNAHRNYKVQEEFNKVNDAGIEIIEFCEKDKVLELEQHYLTLAKDDPNCLNIAFIAGSPKGIQRREEHKKAISEGAKKAWLTRPRKFTEEHRANMSKGLKAAYASGKIKSAGRGGGPPGERCALSKLKEKDILEIYELRRQGWTHKRISEVYNVTREGITMILNGKSWKHLYYKHFKTEDSNAS